MDIGKKNKLTNNLIKIATYLVIFYILFLLGKSLWTNFELKKSIETLKDQIAVLEGQKKDLENLNLYYQSDSFKELEARRKLGYKKPDEKVMVLSATPTPQNFPQEVAKEKEGVAPKVSESQIPIWLLWWEFYTKK